MLAIIQGLLAVYGVVASLVFIYAILHIDRPMTFRNKPVKNLLGKILVCIFISLGWPFIEVD